MLILANTRLNYGDYGKLRTSNSPIIEYILQNARLAYKSGRPLCQDTGLVVIFLKIGQEVQLSGNYIEDEINRAVSDCYVDNFYRKSVVNDAVFDRTNTGTNSPAVIHTKITNGNEIEILLGIKGGGAENMTRLKMMNPTCTMEDILNFVRETVDIAGECACPPVTVGIGAGGTAEKAALYAKYALFKGKKIDFLHKNVLETKIVTHPCHIASLPVCVNLNCHSIRHCACIIKDNEIVYDYKNYIPEEIYIESNLKKVRSDDIEKLKSLSGGEKVLLSGKIYTARDMAHKRFVLSLQKGESLPFNLKNSIIFYAGPAPKKEGEIIGPIGPTTSKRMDKYTPVLYENGVIATIGKGERTLKGGGRLYFKAMGGVACVYQKCVKSAKVIAYEDLGTEAVYELEVADMPLTACFI